MVSDDLEERSAYVSIESGAGGVEALDWTRMLREMIGRWAERKGLSVRVLDEQAAEPTGLRSVLLVIEGQGAYGLLHQESGVHRLVRISPFDSQGRRHTAFASVTVTPLREEAEPPELHGADLRVDVYRAASGGSVEPAVRITHLPTGIVITCRSLSTQIDNREAAQQVLRSRLWAHQHEPTSDGGDLGGVMRTYTLHPVTKVEDHRRSITVSDATAVLGGDLSPFIGDGSAGEPKG